MVDHQLVIKETHLFIHLMCYIHTQMHVQNTGTHIYTHVMCNVSIILLWCVPVQDD